MTRDPLAEATARAHAERMDGVWARREEIEGTLTPLVDEHGEKLPNKGTQRALRRRLEREARR